MKKIIATILMAFVSLGQVHAEAANQATYSPYFVSGVIKEVGTTGTIKLLQGIVVSDSEANARLVFLGLATKQYVGWTVVEVLASTFSQLYKTLPSSEMQQPQNQPAKTPPVQKGVGI